MFIDKANKIILDTPIQTARLDVAQGLRPVENEGIILLKKHTF